MTRYKTRKINIIVCRNEDKDVKLTVGGRLFHGFITRSVKKVCRTPLVHRGLNNLYACPRVVVELYSKKSLKFTDTNPKTIL